jgi:BTB/POZ domain
MSTSDDPLAGLLFEYPGADIILRSRDYHHFRVPKSYLANSSPVLDELIQKALPVGPLDDENGTASLPVVELPETGVIIHSLLTFVFPVLSLIPPTNDSELSMELLSVAQKYQMFSVLAHIRGSIMRQNPPSTQRDTALHIYSLAQKYGLRPEALQAARTILKYPMSIEDLEYKLDIMPGASLYELWKYYEEVRAILSSDLAEFSITGARGTLTGLHCEEYSSSHIPLWLDEYITSIGNSPHAFDHIEFNTALARHLGDTAGTPMCTCESIPRQTIRNFWEALTLIVEGSFEKVSRTGVYGRVTRLKYLQAESALSLVQEREDSQSDWSTSLPETLEVPDPNLIMQSSDLVNFRIHKQVLAVASPFFRDLLSLPQPSDSESVDGIPVVKFPEDAELLNSLVSMLYPVRPVIPDSYDKVLYLLAVCQKYDMDQVQSAIRAEVHRGTFPAPSGSEVFGAYAIASDKGLIPEMENAARLTLDHPMTFEIIGEGLRLFQGSALRDLVRFRKACRDSLVSCLKSFLEADAPGPSSIWVGCPNLNAIRTTGNGRSKRAITPNGSGSITPNEPISPHRPISPKLPISELPTWIYQVLSSKDLSMQVFTHPLTTPSSIRARYLKAIQNHDHCNFCLRVHAKKGPHFGAELENRLKQARDKVRTSFL